MQENTHALKENGLIPETQNQQTIKRIVITQKHPKDINKTYCSRSQREDSHVPIQKKMQETRFPSIISCC